LTGLRCAVGIALVLVLSLAIGHPGYGLVAAGGALPVGFGAFHRLSRFRAAPMLLATLGMSVSTWVGTLTGHATATIIIATGLWGVGSGLLAVLGPAAWWCSLQWTVALVVAQAYPESGGEAAGRALLVFAGGLVETGAAMALWRLRRRVDAPPGGGTAGVTDNPRAAFRALTRNLTLHSPLCRHALRLGATLMLAAAAYRLVELPNGYWLPMTALLVLQPAFRDTVTRGLARIGGTLIGSGLATVIAAALHPGPPTLAVLIVVFAWGCYALLRVNYALFAIGVTAYVVFLLALAGLPEIAVAGHRAAATALGGAFALLAHLFPVRDPSRAL
jgi:hypothetical protein